MSTSYVITGINWQELIKRIPEISGLSVEEKDGDWLISTSDPEVQKYNLRKRIKMAQMIGTPPDYVQQGGSDAGVWLHKTSDPENSWLTGYATSISSPEIVLERIVEYLNNIGLNSYWASEHDEEYDQLAEEGKIRDIANSIQD